MSEPGERRDIDREFYDHLNVDDVLGAAAAARESAERFVLAGDFGSALRHFEIAGEVTLDEVELNHEDHPKEVLIEWLRTAANDFRAGARIAGAMGDKPRARELLKTVKWINLRLPEPQQLPVLPDRDMRVVADLERACDRETDPETVIDTMMNYRAKLDSTHVKPIELATVRLARASERGFPYDPLTLDRVRIRQGLRLHERLASVTLDSHKQMTPLEKSAVKILARKSGMQKTQETLSFHLYGDRNVLFVKRMKVGKLPNHKTVKNRKRDFSLDEVSDAEEITVISTRPKMNHRPRGSRGLSRLRQDR